MALSSCPGPHAHATRNFKMASAPVVDVEETEVLEVMALSGCPGPHAARNFKMASAPVVDEEETEVLEEPYKEVKEDLFTCPDSYSLVHCISADCHMGKGIAVAFKRKFKGVDDLLKQNKKTGDVAILKRGDRFIYYLITKNKFYQKPTYGTLKLSLQAMREHCRTHKVEHLAMPKIGCGLDRLSWPIVSDMIKRIFSDTNVKITIYYQ